MRKERKYPKCHVKQSDHVSKVVLAKKSIVWSPIIAIFSSVQGCARPAPLHTRRPQLQPRRRAQPAAHRLRARRPRFQACAWLLRPVHDLASQLQPALEDLAGAMAPRVFLPAQPRSDMRASYLRVEGANPSGLPPRPRRRMWRRTLRKTCMAA